MTTSPSQWEDATVDAITSEALAELNLPNCAFQVEALGNQIDFERDVLNRATPHVLVAYVGADTSQGYLNGDKITMAFVAVVPGANQRERRALAINALAAISNWMKVNTTYLPTRISVDRVHPFCVATLFAEFVG